MPNDKNKIEIDKNLKLIVKSSFVVFIGLFLSKLLTYVYRIIIARNFGPEIYGVFSLSIMILGWFVLFASLGFSEGLIRYLALFRGKKQYKKIKYLFKINLSVMLFTGLISFITLFFLSEFISLAIFHNSNLIIFLKIFSFLIPIYLFTNIFLSILQAFEKIQWYSFIVNILQNVVKVLALILLIFIGLGSNSIIFSYFLGYLVILVFSYLLCRYKTPDIFGKYILEERDKKATFKSFYSYSWPLLLAVAMSEIFFWTDTFLIGYFEGAKEVGFYNAAIPVVLLLLFVPELFLKLFFPLITREFSNNKKEVVKQLSQQVGKWIFILNLPLFLIMFLFPGVIINILFGSEYLVATNALKILSVGVFFSSLMWIPNNLLSMAGKSKLILMNLIGAALLNLALNLILIPKYGISGAAIATAVSKVLLSFTLFIETKYLLSIIPLRRKVIQIFFLSLIPTLFVFLLRKIVTTHLISLLLIGFLFFLLYTFLIIITKSLDHNDFMILKSIKRRIF